MTDSPVEADPDVDVDIDAIVDIVRAYGHNYGRPYFAGVTADHAVRAITVYRLPDPSFDSSVRGLIGGAVTLRLVDAPHTRDDLLVARERVWALADPLPIESIGIPSDGTRLSIVADAPVDEVQAVLDSVVPGLATAVPATAGSALPL